MTAPRLPRAPHEATINGTRYYVTPFGSAQGRQVLVRLGNVLGPAFSAALTGEGLGGGEDAKAGAMLAVAMQLLGRMDTADLDYFVTEFGPRTMVKTATMQGPGPLDADRIDEHYSANYGEMFQWLWFAIKANFSSFLSVLPKGANMGGPPSPAPSPSPNT